MATKDSIVMPLFLTSVWYGNWNRPKCDVFSRNVRHYLVIYLIENTYSPPLSCLRFGLCKQILDIFLNTICQKEFWITQSNRQKIMVKNSLTPVELSSDEFLQVNLT